MIVCCKDLRVFKVDISGQDEYLNVADSLEKLSAIGKKAGISMPSFLKNLFRNGKKTQVYLIHFFFFERGDELERGVQNFRSSFSSMCI